MNNYFHYITVFFSFFVMPAFAMETKDTIPGKEIAAELIALTHLPKEKAISKNLLLHQIEQNKKDAEDWFNKGTEPVQNQLTGSQEILLNYFVKRGTNVPTIFKFDSYFAPNQQNTQQFDIQKTIKKESSNYEQFYKFPYIRKTPVNISDVVSPIDGRKKTEKISERQNCLLM